MAGQGTLILASDYNAIQAKVALLLGSGSGLYGYGQTVLSSSVSTTSKISIAQWSNLRTDLLRVRTHQTDTPGTLTLASASVKIQEADRAAYNAMADAATANYLITPPASQATREALVSTQTRSTAWNGDIQQVITITFTDANAARYFFNSGSRIEISSDLVGGTSTPGGKTDTWRTLLTNMGTIYFNYNATTYTGFSAAGSSYGWTNLPSTATQIFEKDVSGSTYYPNRYVILAAKPTSNQLVFTIQWRDDSGQPNIPWGTDENVDGVLNSYVQVYRASGSNVSVPNPPATTTSIG